MELERVICIVQARMGSQRFPGKVLAMLNGHPVIWHVYTRCKQAVPNTVVAIPVSPENDPLADYLKTIDAPVFRWDGPENDVLGRYAACLKMHPADWVVRVTGDCPLVDPSTIKGQLAFAHHFGRKYFSNTYPFRAVHSGFDVEVMTAAALKEANKWATNKHDREHVTPWIQRTYGGDPTAKFSVDTPADLDRIRALVANG